MERQLEEIDHDRRRYLGRLAAAIAGAGLGVFGVNQAIDRVSREFSGLDRAREWINSPRLTASSLAGKVVLVDFWTYTCINWLRTLPYIRAWAQKYRQQLVVIGVHTPEFPFEHDIENVRRAVRQMAIEYPVAIDNDYAVWRAFRNQYWPALYFVDGRGRIRDHHFGEGNYEQSERTAQKLLAEAGGAAAPGHDLVSVAASGVEAPADWSNLRSPENYLGFARTEGFVSPGGAQLDRSHAYASPTRLTLNQWALAGEWTVTRGLVALQVPNGRLDYCFHARDVHLIMGAARQRGPVRFRASLDGQPPGAAHGLDADAAGNGTVIEPRLYQLIRQTTPIVTRQLEIEFLDAGAEAFCFTFG
jgi:thiol-disulfide isomerase/thioredoxin